jgi:hypothetical protein
MLASMSANIYIAAQGTNKAEEFCIIDWSIVLVRSIQNNSV